MDSGVWIINNKSENYFHWMTESLARVLSFQKLNKSGIILLPDHFNKLEFVSKTLDMLNVEHKTYSTESLVKVKNLFLTTHTAPAGNYNSNIILDLHSKLNKGTKSVRGERFWLSRKFSNRRMLLNEEEISSILSDYGIEIIYPEHLSYYEQCKLFRKAEFIGGPAGAALTNMLFMEMSSTVLELRHKNDDLNNCHYSLASTLKNNFYYLICESDSDDNSIVNEEHLKDNLKEIFKG
jgi:capsular polysaccharide biosynthesis protein